MRYGKVTRFECAGRQIYPPPHVDSFGINRPSYYKPRRPPVIGWDALTFIGVLVAVVVAVMLSGCSGPPTSTTQAKRDAIGPLAETAAAATRIRPFDVEEPPVYRTPALPAAAEAYTVPLGPTTFDDVAPAWEPLPPAVVPPPPNAEPCVGDNCPTSTAPRLFRRWRR
jgi:hypothetical protein